MRVKMIRKGFHPINTGGIILVLSLFSILITSCTLTQRRLPQSPWMAQIERKSGLIAYIGTDGNIYTMDQGGTNQQQITTNAHLPNEDDPSVLLYQAPTWSPDGQNLAFVGVSGSAGQESVEAASLFTVSLEDLNIVETFTSDHFIPFYIYWSPAGERLGFLSNTNTGRGLALFEMPASGGEARLIDAGSPYFWSWAPDGTSIATHAGALNQTISMDRMSLLNLGDGGVKEQVLNLAPSEFQTPAWTPDGEHVIVAVRSGGNRVLVMLDKDGHLERALTTFKGEIAFSVSPDGKQVALISGDNLQAGFLQGQLKVLGLEDPTQGYTTEEENAMAFFWSPDSKKVAYFPYQVLTVKLTPEQGESEGSERATPYQTVRLKVLDLDKDGETREVTYPFPPTDLFMSVLALFTQYQQSASIWSPDSQNLVLSAHLPDGSPVIWVVRASGRLEPRYLVNGVLAFWSRR